MHHGPIHQALTKELNPGHLGLGLCNLVPRIVSEPLFQSSSEKINSAGNEVEGCVLIFIQD